jgi:hypothetical protein
MPQRLIRNKGAARQRPTRTASPKDKNMNQRASHHWKRFEPIPGLEPVRETRRDVQVPVEVCSFDILEHLLTERSDTHNVSDGGSKFCLRTEIAQDAVLAIS